MFSLGSVHGLYSSGSYGDGSSYELVFERSGSSYEYSSELRAVTNTEFRRVRV
jgi:hypothetical protein